MRMSCSRGGTRRSLRRLVRVMLERDGDSVGHGDCRRSREAEAGDDDDDDGGEEREKLQGRMGDWNWGGRHGPN
jgi:hypothetical protein